MKENTKTTKPAAKDPAAGTQPGKNDKQTMAAAINAESNVSTGIIVITMLAVSELRPSGWNPNVMTAEQFSTYLQEVKTKRKIAKPIVVVQGKKGFIIVDGEHAWKAAKEAGLTHVPCEIVDIKLFEAMRQTLVRNRHGENNPVLLGRLYERMLKAGKLSNRELADQIGGVTEGTIRNQLKYATAAKLRNDYAPDGADELISSLTSKEVTAYLNLKDKGDEWLDSEGSLEDAEKLMAPKSDTNAASDSATQSHQDDEDDESDSDMEDDKSQADPENARPSGDEEDGEASDDDGGEPAVSHADLKVYDNDSSAAGGGISSPAPATTDTPDNADESFDDGVLDVLEETWARANQATRKKFLSGVVADPDMQKFVRQMVKQGA